MKFQPITLQQRTLFYILVPTFVLLVVLSLGGFVLVRGVLLNQWGETAVATLQRTAHEIDMRLSRPKELLLLLEDGNDSELNRQIFASVQRRIAALDGVVAVAVEWQKEVEPAAVSAIRQETMTGMQHAHANRFVITTPQYNKDLKNRTVSLVFAFAGSTGQGMGRVEVSFSFDALIAEVIRAPWWKSNKAYLVDDSGNVLIGTSLESALEDHFPMRAFGTVSTLEQNTLEAMRSNNHGTVFGPGTPPEEVSGYYHLSEAPWTMVIMAPGEAILQPIIRFKYFYFFSFSACILLILLLIRITTSRLTARIKDISGAADDLARGRFGPPLAVTTRDEVGELAGSFNKMSRQLRQRLRMKEAIDVAREVQQNLLPQAGFVATGLEAAGLSFYCDETGGDYFDIIRFADNDRKIGVAVGDVVGHGIGAALLMTTVRALLRCRIAQPGRMSEVIRDVNRLLCQDTAVSGSFVTLFYLEVDRRRNSIGWVRAGHEPAIVYSPATKQFSELKGQGVALGVDADRSFQYNELPVAADEQIILIGSDGAWEAENDAGEQFGRERLKHFLAAAAGLPPDRILQTIVDEISRFRGGAPQHDDITLVAVKTR
jgi:sigma-B regulation protein RsbU (phosphoserine phosphatase)